VILHQREKEAFPLFTQTGYEGYEAFQHQWAEGDPKGDFPFFHKTEYEGTGGGFFFFEREMK
jgi:hypothetical protein